MTSAIAAVAWDFADAVHTAPTEDAGDAIAFSAGDAFLYRNTAIKQINAEILLLLQGTTLFSFATTYHDAMLRYVFLWRALQGRASIDEVTSLLPCRYTNTCHPHCGLDFKQGFYATSWGYAFQVAPLFCLPT